MMLKRNFKKYKEFLFLLFLCLAIFLFNVALEFFNYKKFKEQKHLYLENVKILQNYSKVNKNGKKYFVFKLQNDEFSFYTTSYKDLNLSKNQILNLVIITKNISFKDYLSKTFYAPSYDFKILKEQKQNTFIDYFLNQHKDEKVKEFFGALFFALNISSELRNDVNYYGIAHLIAISGYHIALLFSFIFFILAPLYGFFQKRYFPYRNLRFDLSILIFILLFTYSYLIGFVPSYVRSLVMALWGFYLLCKNIKIFSFFNLFVSVCICLALYPRLLFSVGFLFSVMGVFYIFLYMHHFSKYFKTFSNILLLNIWTFLAMILPVLYFFPLISYQQFLAIFLSMIFAFFYPLVLFLHFVNLGGLLDNYLLEFFNFKLYGMNLKISFELFILYLALSLLSIRFKILAFLCVFANLIPFALIYT